MRKLLLASTLLLIVGAATLPRAQASSPPVGIVVVDSGIPAAGQRVVVMASEGKYEGVTNKDGLFSVAIQGKYFRVRVNDQPVPGVHSVSTNPVRVELQNL